MYDGSYYWPDWYFSNNGSICDATGMNVADSDAIELEDGTVWCREHFMDYGVEIDGCYYDRDNIPDEVAEEEEIEPNRQLTPAEIARNEAAGQERLPIIDDHVPF
jgi:hypothetical protein